ncbi:MAG: DNA polymerase III subunit beta [Acidobacteriota bacterium]
MELTIPASVLARELSLIQGVVEKRTTHQILTNVLLEARNGVLSLTATDLDTTLVSEIPTTAQKSAGAVTAPARRLYDVVRELPPNAELKLKVLENNHVSLECKEPKLRIRLNGLPAGDYPTRPEPAGGPSLTLPFGALRRMVDKVRFAVSTEEMRLQLQGALLKAKNGVVEMVATDGHRLALVEVEGSKADSGFEPVLVSKKILDELGKLDAAEDAVVTIVRGTNHIGFVVGNRKLFSKLDERRFPDYEKVISKENDKKAVVPREELLGAVRRIALLSGDRTKAVSLAFDKGSLVVSSESQEVGDGSQEIPAAYDSTPVTLRLNARYLEQFLEAAETKDVHLFVKDEQAQCQGRPGEPLGGIRSYLYVVMPMRM